MSKFKAIFITLAAFFSLLTLISWIVLALKNEAFSWADEFSDFSLNIFTGILVLVLGLLVFDKIIKIYDHQKNLPVKAALHREVQLVMSRITGLVASMYNASVPEGEFTPKTINDLFSEKTFSLLNKYLNISAVVTLVNIKPLWIDYLSNESNDYKNRIDKIFNRYVQIEPDLFNNLHTLEDRFITSLSQGQLIYSLHKRRWASRPVHWESCFSKLETIDFEYLKQTCNWCNKTYTELKDKYTLYKIAMPKIERRLTAHITQEPV
jgi:hypothetical protein